MAMVRKYQNNFTTGVMSPGVYSRVDLAKYSAGAKRIVNGVVLAHGGYRTARVPEWWMNCPGRDYFSPLLIPSNSPMFWRSMIPIPRKPLISQK